MKLLIEWRHIDVDGETCNRCYDTGENLNHEVKRLNKTLQQRGISVEFIDSKLNNHQVAESNKIYFNGIPIEKIIDMEVLENFCESCSSLMGKKTFCRSIIFEGNEYEDVPAKAIRQAALKVLGLDESKVSNKSCCNGSNCC